MIRRIDPVYRYVAVVCAVGLAAFATILGRGLAAGIFGSVRFWVFALCVLAAELVPIRLPGRREAVTVTVSGPFVLALLLTKGLLAAVLAIAFASAVDDLLRRKAFWKMLFNISQYTLSLTAANFVLTSLTDLPRAQDTFVAAEVLGILATVMTYFAVNVVIVGAGIAMARQLSILKSLRSDFALQATHQPALLALAPIVVASADHSIWLTPLLLLPMVVVYHSITVSVKQKELAENLGSLYAATRMSHSSSTLEEFLHDLLRQTSEMFQAEAVSITMFSPEEGGSHMTSTYMPDGEFRFNQPTMLDPKEGVWARVTAEGSAVLLKAPIENDRLREYFGSQGIKDAMVAALHTEGETLGFISVSNRAGDQTFDEGSLRLLEMLTNHASVSIQNAFLVSKLEESLVHLREMNQLKDDFVASVSHELRTPLTSIRGYVRTLLRPDADFSPEDQKSFLETVDRQSTRLHRLIEDLLAVSRIESASDPTVLAAVSLPFLLNDVIDEVRTRVDPSLITVRLEEDMPAVQTDAGKVHQIVSNLIDNAAKYGGPDNPILVEARRETEGVIIAVTDKGPGVPSELQDKIFERFYQIDQSATRSVGGAGLGLYICRRMAEAIGGRVWLERTSPDGSTFSVWIPLKPQPATALQTVGPSDGGWKL
ncbi:MAG TPA: ATP-binding protein [Actinomycetota bacterium]|nr:ATP-binding protein [Actinomycetota bacterium]